MSSKLSALVGLTFNSVIQNSVDEIHFSSTCGRKFKMYHEQDCCETVSIEEVIGDYQDLIDSPILVAEERSENDDTAPESGTWTFYELATNKGSVTIRWYGHSNGYYSESAHFTEVA